MAATSSDQEALENLALEVSRISAPQVSVVWPWAQRYALDRNVLDAGEERRSLCLR